MTSGPDLSLLPLQQHPRFGAALARIGRPPLIVSGLTVLRRRFAGLPVAMLTRFDPGQGEMLPDIVARAGLGAWPLVLAPDGPFPASAPLGSGPRVAPVTVAELDLGAPLDALRRNLSGKWRNRLKAAEASGLSVSDRPMPLDPDHWLLRADTTQGRQRGYRNWPVPLTLAYATAHPGKARLFTARDRTGEEIAAMLFLRHGKVATYHLGHSTETGRDLAAHNLLMWTAIERLARAGCTRLDLGLANGEDAAGLLHFKLGTGARLRPLGGTWGWWPPLGRSLRPLARLDRRLMQLDTATNGLPARG